MPRTHSSLRRRRRGRFTLLLKLFSVFAIIGALIIALTLFFRVEHIEVVGNERYSREEIVEASGIALEDNLILMNKFAIATQIYEQLPYVEQRSIRRTLPGTITITVSECRAAAAIPDGDGYVLVSSLGKILEQTDVRPDSCPVVTGAVLYAPVLSKTISFGEGSEAKQTKLLELLAAASERGLLSAINAVDMSDDTMLRLTYLNRFSVKLPWDTEMDYKLQSLMTVEEYLEDNETGEINLMTEGKASFIPRKS